MRILIVDDSKLARMAVIECLKHLHPDWTRIEAANVDEALQLMEQHHSDIALLDYQMPGRNGLELARELRKLNANMPIAIISANLQQEVIDGSHALGAVFLPKPLRGPALGAFLEDAVRQLTKVHP